MAAASTTDGPASITDKRARGPFTPKDDTVARELMYLRTLLVQAPDVRQRLERLGAVWSAADSPETRVRFYHEVAELARDLDATWSTAELADIARRWLGPPNPYRDLAGGGYASMGFTAGRRGRGRPLSSSTIELVARSITLRASGLRWAEADAIAAAYHHTAPETVALYRMRLRDRRDGTWAASPSG